MDCKEEIARPSGRAADEKRIVRITRHFTRYAEGSVLMEEGETRVCCTASVQPGVPAWLKGKGCGWVTAEYGLLPRATGTRTEREATRGKQSGRTQEIQRLIGRSLRAVVDLEKLGENTVKIDCDVLQADGGTRTAAITGAWVAAYDAFEMWKTAGRIKTNPLFGQVAAVSVGLVEGRLMLDLDYEEDSNAEIDMNVVMNAKGEIVEIQGTGEQVSFSRDRLNEFLDMAEEGIEVLLAAQKEVLGIE